MIYRLDDARLCQVSSIIVAGGWRCGGMEASTRMASFCASRKEFLVIAGGVDHYREVTGGMPMNKTGASIFLIINGGGR